MSSQGPVVAREAPVARSLFDTLKKLRGPGRPGAPSTLVVPPPAPPPAAVEPEGPRDHVRRVLAAIEAEDLGGALMAATAGTTAWPGYAELWFLRFDLELHTDDLDAGRATLEHIARHDPLNQPGAEICLEILAASVQRREVLSGRGEPELVGPGGPGVESCQEAIAALASGDLDRAERAVLRGREQATPLAGSADDAPFRELRDVDDSLAHVLELLSPGRYRWIALDQLAWIEVLPLRTFLDFAWVPVHVELRGGQELRGHVPGLYLGTGAHAEDRVRLGHETRWERVAPALARAYGQRRWQTEDRLIDLRRLHVLSFT